MSNEHVFAYYLLQNVRAPHVSTLDRAIARAPTVKDVAKKIVSIDASKTVVEAANLMKDYGRGSLIVYVGPWAQGIITERDLIRRVLAENLPNTTKVEENGG